MALCLKCQKEPCECPIDLERQFVEKQQEAFEAEAEWIIRRLEEMFPQEKKDEDSGPKN